MSVETLTPRRSSEQPVMVSGDVQCALTGKTLKAEDAYWAPPLVTARTLITAILTNLVRTPSNLGHVLFDEQPNVPYAPEAREQLGTRRTAEQLKLLVVLLLIAALIVVPIVLLVT